MGRKLGEYLIIVASCVGAYLIAPLPLQVAMYGFFVGYWAAAAVQR